MKSRNIPNKSGIYCITHVNTGRKYIGSSVNMKKRIIYHTYDLKANRHANPKLQRAVNKYGLSAFQASVLDYCEEPSELRAREQQWINTTKPWYNIRTVDISTGLGTKRSPEVRLKMSQAQMGNKKWVGKQHTEESKRKISKANSGPKNGMYGRTFSVEERLKLSQAQRKSYAEGKIPGMLGKKDSKETRLRKSQAQKARREREKESAA